MNDAAKERIVREACERLAPFGLDLTHAQPCISTEVWGGPGEVSFTLPNGAVVCLSAVWFNVKTGEILQAGSNGGELTL